jgi:hypothetical protein
LPDLRFCSDIFWGYWFNNNPNVKNLRLYGAYKVLNKEASQLVARAFTKNGHESIDSWPGVSFDHTTPEGQALIGSPIGATIAHMLIGHKAELGVKWINKVSVFNYDANPDGSKSTLREVNIFFHIEVVPQLEIEDPEKDKGGGSGGGDADPQLQSRTIRVQNDDKNILREHNFIVKL